MEIIKEKKMKRNKILVAVDFEEQSIKALQQSYHLAKLFDAELLLFHVVEETGILKNFFSHNEYNKKVLQKAKERLNKLEKTTRNTFADSNIVLNPLIAKGKPYEQIIQAAIDNSVILIIMGKNSVIEKQGRKFVGSNNLNVVREAPCPVISIKGNGSFSDFSNILLPLDFTKPFQKQIQHAIKLGGYFGSTINILSVLPGDNKMNKLYKQVQINQVKNIIAKSGLRCTAEIVKSKGERICETIIKYARKIDADLILLMTQQKKHVVPFFIGSTAHEIIYESEIPVFSLIPSVKFNPGVITSFVDPLGLMERKSKKHDLNNQ